LNSSKQSGTPRQSSSTSQDLTRPTTAISQPTKDLTRPFQAIEVRRAPGRLSVSRVLTGLLKQVWSLYWARWIYTYIQAIC